jgi:hypothetical protein
MALLVLGAIIGVPVAAAAYFFLEGFTELQQYLFGTLPGDLGFEASLPGGRFRCCPERPAGGAHNPVSAGNSWAQAGGRFKASG